LLVWAPVVVAAKRKNLSIIISDVWLR